MSQRQEIEQPIDFDNLSPEDKKRAAQMFAGYQSRLDQGKVRRRAMQRALHEKIEAEGGPDRFDLDAYAAGWEGGDEDDDSESAGKSGKR